MPLVQTRGAASAQGFGEFAQPAVAANYIEDVFSTYLWDGNSTARSIVNGIDLATYGGMVWAKYRNATASNRLYDTNRGATKQIFSDLTLAEQVATQSLTAFNTDGFSLGTGQPNETTATVVGWTFRKQAKFFDIVTYTGNGVAGRTVSHNLGSVPGMMIVKATSVSGYDWQVYHRSLGNSAYAVLNTTAAASTGNIYRWNNTTPTSTVFTLGDGTFVNENGTTYVAYLFAHDAGGFGTTGTDNVISCGSVVGAGNPTEVNLGYEPQFLLIKNASSAQDWWLVDNMRGLVVQNASASARLNANTSGAEITLNVRPTATGFISGSMSSGATYIYMAIRRPMKVPTTGTSVFYPKVHAGSSSYAVGFPTDLCIAGDQSGNALNSVVVYRLGGNDKYFGGTASTAAEQTVSVCQFDLQDNFQLSYNSNNQARWHFRRASGFFDVVCYTGDGASTRQVTHNLGVTPQLIIIKNRGVADSWEVRYPSVANNKDMLLNSTGSQSNLAFTPADTITTFTVSVSGSAATNDNANTYVAYLFATCPSVSKVGSYTGNGGTQAIACGFTGGARFVLIKRTDASGDWYVYDTARGMTTLTDPYLLLNSTAAETATLGSVTTTAGGFTVNSAILAAINSSGGTYIFLAIA